MDGLRHFNTQQQGGHSNAHTQSHTVADAQQEATCALLHHAVCSSSFRETSCSVQQLVHTLRSEQQLLQVSYAPCVAAHAEAH